MNFEMSDERRMLADTLSRVLAEKSPVEARADTAYAAPWYDENVWSELRHLGAIHALVSEEDGGMGGTGFDIAVVFEEMGRALCPAPLLSTMMAARLYAHFEEVPYEILTGERDYAVAIGESEAPYDVTDITAVATPTSDFWRYEISGRKSVVYGAGNADVLLVAAKVDGKLEVFEVLGTGPEIAAYGMIDGGGAAEVILDRTTGRLLKGNAEVALQNVLDLGALALCAEALGAMDKTLAYLTDYLKTRMQFGKPLGAFQVLQHRAVDLAIEVEQARSIVVLAASAEGTNAFGHRVSQAKHLVGKIAQQVAEETIQMHGGIGITWEYPVSHFAKRLVMIDAQLGDTDWHLERLMAGLAEA